MWTLTLENMFHRTSLKSSTGHSAYQQKRAEISNVTIWDLFFVFENCAVGVLHTPITHTAPPPLLHRPRGRGQAIRILAFLFLFFYASLGLLCGRSKCFAITKPSVLLLLLRERRCMPPALENARHKNTGKVSVRGGVDL